MTATIIPAAELARRRAEREKERQRRAWQNTSLRLLDDEDEEPRAPASPPAREQEPRR
jgi:hypothetical protein